MFEDSNGILSTFKQIKKYLSVRLITQLAIFFCGLVISSFGLFQLFNNDVQASQVTSGDEDKNDGEYIENSDEAIQICEKNPEFGRLVVDIGGAIKEPGVYELEVGSRINDLINMAGGFSNSVDKHYINKILNSSKRLSDGEKLYIPTIEESIELQTADSEKKSGNDSTNTSITGTISINSASKNQLMSLVGIGEKRAEDIITERPYDSLEKLVEKEVITSSIFEGIKNDVSL